MNRDAKQLVRDIAVAALRDLAAATGEAAYRGDQLAHWLYRDAVWRWDDMSNLPRRLRMALAAGYDLQGLRPLERQVSRDGTRKHLFELRDGHRIESVAIPMDRHVTYCISSQVGCAMACSFCATARGGLARDLTAGEIVEQVLRLGDDLRRDPAAVAAVRGHNVVFMGMGEPLDNLEAVFGAIATFTDERGLAMSPRRITVSTSGHAEGLRRLAASPLNVGLTVAAGSSRPELRRRLMPVPGRTPLPEILELAERYARTRRRRVTVAYVLLDGVNDDDGEAAALARELAGRPFKVNLIPLNRIDERHGPPPPERVLAFQAVLREAGVEAYVRVSGGNDIAAACGQLREKRGRADDAGDGSGG
jgi:23S rRNA (adenine2503-C2)-methyltransferase